LYSSSHFINFSASNSIILSIITDSISELNVPATSIPSRYETNCSKLAPFNNCSVLFFTFSIFIIYIILFYIYFVYLFYLVLLFYLIMVCLSYNFFMYYVFFISYFIIFY